MTGVDGDSTQLGRDELIDVAAALLAAAILNRDLVGSMPPKLLADMPSDLRNRLQSPRYQESFELLPSDIQAEAKALVDRDPDVVAARRLHNVTPAPRRSS